MQPRTSRQRFVTYLSEINSSSQRNGTKEVEGLANAFGETKHAPRTFLQLMSAFLTFLRGEYWILALSVIALTIAMLLRLAPPLAMKVVVDEVLTGRPLPAWVDLLPYVETRFDVLVFLAVGAFVVVVFVSGVRLWVDWATTKLTFRLQVAVQKKVFAHTLRLPLHRVHEIKSGGASSLLRSDTECIGQMIRMVIYDPWQYFIQIAGSFCVLAWVDWRLLSGLAVFPMVYMFNRRRMGSMRMLFRDIRRQRERIDGFAVDSLSGIRVVRTFGGERFEILRYVRENLVNGRQQMFAWRRRRTIGVLFEVLVPLVSLVVLLYGGGQVLKGNLSMGDMSMFLLFAFLLLGPLSKLVDTFSDVQNSFAALDRILDLLAEPTKTASRVAAVKINRNHDIGALSLYNVNFKYPRSQQFVLKDINLELLPGETVALIGRSGAGKTTLCHLVARFYDPTSGQMFLNGRDVQEIDVESYRRLIAIVEQDVTLFDGTVRSNIAYAKPWLSDFEVENAARAARAHEFIVGFDDGYETMVGERGVKLSGGQRQRLSIARAFLADPRILILDEATSNLDSYSERLVQQSLREITRNRSCLIIAHRMSTIAYADRIIVMEDGRIVESGTHEHLMSHHSSYRELVAMQTSLTPSH